MQRAEFWSFSLKNNPKFSKGERIEVSSFLRWGGPEGEILRASVHTRGWALSQWPHLSAKEREPRGKGTDASQRIYSCGFWNLHCADEEKKGQKLVTWSGSTEVTDWETMSLNFSCWNPFSPELVALAQGVWRSSAAGWEAPVQEREHPPGHNLDVYSRKQSITCGFLTAWTFGELSSPCFIWHSWWGGGNFAESGHPGNTSQWLWWVFKFLSVGQKLPLCGWDRISSLQDTSSKFCLVLGSAYDLVWIPARITSLRSCFLPLWCSSCVGCQAYLGWYRRRGSSMPAAVSTESSSWWTGVLRLPRGPATPGRLRVSGFPGGWMAAVFVGSLHRP